MKTKTKTNSLESASCKCYRPGDPEFEILVGLVTPLHKIRSELSSKQTLYNENKSAYGWRRNESVNDLFAGVAFSHKKSQIH